MFLRSLDIIWVTLDDQQKSFTEYMFDLLEDQLHQTLTLQVEFRSSN